MRISDWSSDVCSSDLVALGTVERAHVLRLRPADHELLDPIGSFDARLPRRDLDRDDERVINRAEILTVRHHRSSSAGGPSMVSFTLPPSAPSVMTGVSVCQALRTLHVWRSEERRVGNKGVITCRSR